MFWHLRREFHALHFGAVISVPGVVGHAGRLIHVGPFLLSGILFKIHFCLRWRTSWQNFWCYRWLTDVSQDALDDSGLFDEGNNTHRRKTVGTKQWEAFVYAHEE